LLQKEADAARQYAMMNNNITRTSETAGAPSIFPNPVTNYSFNVLFDDVRDGRYSIVISDLAGRNLQTRTVSIGKGAQTERINLSRSTTKGVYLVKILNEQMELISVQKVVVQ
ncbi:MAG TPA: T9SS type A sorting domain-containing protein, partial [Ferruginibacter sp.]|nr:T9SS type A sorting domain-containing protein [Ferruginibacter sp.]